MIARFSSKANGFIQCRRGASAIEFSFSVFIFFIMIFFVAEISRVAYISSVLDLAVSEAAKSAKNNQAASSDEYQQRFQNMIKNRGGTIWHFLSEDNDVQVSVTYASTVDEMINTGGSNTSATNMPLARYFLRYRYRPMFFPFPKVWASTLLNREVIFVQEYERTKFID